MPIFSSNRDLDSTITTIGIHVLMGAAMYFHFNGSETVGSIMSELLIAYTGVCSYLFGKAKGSTTNGD